MSNMTVQMKAMKENILASKHNRGADLKDLTSYTSSLLSSYRQERKLATAAQNKALSSETRKLAKDSQVMLSRFQKDRIQEGKDLQQAGKVMRASLTADRLGRERATEHLIKGFRSSRNKIAHAQTKELEGFVHGIKSEVHSFIKHAHKSRAEMGRETAKMLQETVSSVRQQTDELAANSRGLVKEFHHSRITMGKQLDKQLVADTSERRRSVNTLLDGFRSAQNALGKDLAGAKEIWLGSRSTAQKHATSKFTSQQKEPLPQLSEEERLLGIISKHPEGISAFQVGEMIGIDTLLVGQITKKLAEDGKIRKDKKTRLCFPSNDDVKGEK